MILSLSKIMKSKQLSQAREKAERERKLREIEEMRRRVRSISFQSFSIKKNETKSQIYFFSKFFDKEK